MKTLSREPALWIAVASAALSLVATFGFQFLTATQAALIVAAVNAIAACVTAWAVRPIAPAVFTGAAAAVLAVGGAYGLHLSQATIGGVNVLAVAVLTLLTRGHVSPASAVPATPPEG